MSRLLGNDGVAITQATIAGITRTITDTVTGVITSDTVTVADTVFDDLQANDARWSSAGGSVVGYNFCDAIPASSIAARRKYTLQYTFTPTIGEVFKTKEIDVIGD